MFSANLNRDPTFDSSQQSIDFKRQSTFSFERGDNLVRMDTALFPACQSMEARWQGIFQRLVNSKVAADDQWQALHDLRHLLDADHSSVQNSALDHGADRMLLWLLESVAAPIIQQQQTSGDFDYAVANKTTTSLLTLICECLALLWSGCSSERRIGSLQLVGKGTLPVLLHLWKLFPYDSHSQNNHVHVSILRPILQILRLWAKLCKKTAPELKNMLLQSELVECIKDSASRWSVTEGVTHTTGNDRNPPLKRWILGLIKDLTFRADNSDKEYLYNELKEVVFLHCTDNNDGVKEDMSAALWNWAAHERLGRCMAENEALWPILDHLLSEPTTIESIPIHRNVASALGTMVAAWTAATNNPTSVPSKTSPPVQLVQQGWLVPRLLQVLEHETDIDWRRRCIRTVRCLASCSWGRDFLWKCTSNSTVKTSLSPSKLSPEIFVDILLQVLQNENDGVDTRIHVYQTISTFLTAEGEWKRPITQKKNFERILVDAMVNHTSPEKLVLAAANTLSLWVQLNNDNSNSNGLFGLTIEDTNLLSSDLFFQRILDILQHRKDDPSYHSGFSNLLHELITAQRLLLARSGDEKKPSSCIVCCSPMLSTLAELIAPIGPDFETSRQKAIAMIACLVQDDHHKKSLAENESLLSALVNFCLITSGPLKEDAKQAILMLVPEL